MNVKKFFKILLLLLLAALAVFGGITAAWVTSKPFASGEHGDALAEIGKDGIVNFLVVGRDSVGENTDVIMVASLHTKNNTISILSIPRDTRVNVNGSRKINSVYGYAGACGMKKEETLIETVSTVSGLPIHYFAIVNLRAFREVVDELGGVEFDVKRPYHYEDPYQDLYIHIEPGYQVLDGEKAEGLIRYRHDYAMGDIDRVGVQQEFISALLKQKLQMRYITKISAVYDKVTDYVISNIKVSDLVEYAKELLGCEMATYMLPGTTGTSDGYWIQNDAETRALIRDKFGYTAEN